MSDSQTNSISYVRETMLPEQAPPVSASGPIKWVRENLFSSWMNILLTIIALYVVYSVLALLLPWAFGGVWNAGSLTECREVLHSFYKDSHSGACWAVIEDRWLQITFGFYPPELYWRPILAFVLFFIALAPILFADKVPGQLIWFTMIFPFLATWLIWGGSFWSPILVALGFVIAVVAYKIISKIAGPIVANLAAIVAALLWWGVAMGVVSDGLHKMVGNSRLESTLADLNAQAETLPQELETLTAQADEKGAEIAAALEEKNALLAQMDELRAEESVLAEQIEPKEVAFQRLEGAEETVAKIQGLLEEWGGAPVAADGASEVDVAIAAAASEEMADYLGDVNSLLSGALSDIADNTVDPADVAALMVNGAIDKDSSIQDDFDSMVSLSDLTGPIELLVDRSAGLTDSTSVADFASIRADIATVAASVDADIATLQQITDKVIATNVSGLEEPQAALLSTMARLTELRDEATVIAQADFRLSSQQTENRGMLNSLDSLEAREASVPELFASASELRAELPRGYRNMIAVNQLPEDATSEDEAALGAYLAADEQAKSVEASVRDTYSNLGRVGLAPINSRQIGGFMMALIIGIAGIVLSLPLGILLALGRQSHLFIVQKICVTFIEVIRGVPLIVWLFTASLLLNYFLPPGTNFDLLLRVIIMVTLFSAAYIAEVIRGGLAALPTGQYEGADSLGLSYWQSMQLIILPQAMKISIPGIVNTFIGLFKDTTLVLFIGLLDPIGLSQAIRSSTDWNGIYWELFVFIGLLFFIFCFSMGRYSLFLEKKLQREHR